MVTIITAGLCPYRRFLHELSCDPKPTYLLSSAYGLTVAERRWVEEHRATVTKLGSFHPGRNFAPLQTRMVRQQKPVEKTLG